MAADAIRVALVASALVHVAVQALSAWETGRWGARHAGALGVTHPAGSPSLTGCYLATVAPLAPWWTWPAFALGLYWSGPSWLALGALSGALLLGTGNWAAWTAGALLATLAALVVRLRPCVAGRVLAEWLPRGDSLDPLWLRLRTWRVVAAVLPTVLWRHPWGRRPLGWDLRRHITATGARVQDDHAFNEYLEVVYEYGIVGVVGVVTGGVLLVRTLVVHPGDPFTAALVVWALTMGGSITLRTWPFPALAGLLLLGAWAS